MMPKVIEVASVQCHTLANTADSLHKLESKVVEAADSGVDLILFPEVYLGGYPRTASFGTTVGQRTLEGYEQFLQYFHSAVDFGDTPIGAEDDWIECRLPTNDGEHRGDGTREELERIARETRVYIVTGVLEKCGGSLYCSVVYVDPAKGFTGKRRKVMPTGSERLVWA